MGRRNERKEEKEGRKEGGKELINNGCSTLSNDK